MTDNYVTLRYVTLRYMRHVKKNLNKSYKILPDFKSAFARENTRNERYYANYVRVIFFVKTFSASK